MKSSLLPFGIGSRIGPFSGSLFLLEVNNNFLGFKISLKQDNSRESIALNSLDTKYNDESKIILRPIVLNLYCILYD